MADPQDLNTPIAADALARERIAEFVTVLRHEAEHDSLPLWARAQLLKAADLLTAQAAHKECILGAHCPYQQAPPAPSANGMRHERGWTNWNAVPSSRVEKEGVQWI